MDALSALTVGTAVAFAFVTGVNDCGALAASVVSSRRFSPRKAAMVGAASSLLGALLMGSAVARMLGSGLVRLEHIPAAARPAACACAGLAALAWALAGRTSGLPTSSTHAILGAWLGAFVGLGGLSVVSWGSVAMVIAVVLLSPFIGLAAAWAAYRALLRFGEELARPTLPLFKAVEGAAFAALCFANGANAAQRAMALWVMGLVPLASWSNAATFHIPIAARLACAAAFALGILLGSTRTLTTMAFRIFRVGPLHSVCALLASTGLVLAATAGGVPVSAGQIACSALMGAGAGHNVRSVRWSLASDVLLNWALTVPAPALAAYILVRFVR
ncbi:MAG TPA: inorganic phosphate transporter [Elusimicrobiota bacterium]|jgi:PiT family inorganic phosphate transporter|nr:inorganic phosphate transporter [Elusimicrobiota bacterium]